MTTLWYRQPANVWTDALPIGNGRLGGMVFGGVAQERIALNDDTLWSGAPQDGTNPGAFKTLGQVRELLAAGKYAEADEMSKLMMGPYTQSYLAMGNLNLAFDGVGEAEDYRRELDLATGIATTTFTASGTRFTREAFVSCPDQALAVRLTADGPAKLSFTATLDSLLPFATQAHDGELMLTGKAPALVDPTYYRRAKVVHQPDGEGMRFAVRLLAHQTDGTVVLSADSLRVTDATHVTLLLTAATSFDGFDQSPTRPGRPEKVIAATQMESALRRPYETLKRTHVEDHNELFDRVDFSLATHDDRPTDELLADGGAGARRRLAELMFQYGRYLLITSSRRDTQPANLQGIWNEEMRAPWSGNYTSNINVQMNYWPAEPANLAECHRPLLKLVQDLQTTGGEIARVNYHCSGWCAHHNVDVWRHAAPAGNWGAPPADPVWAVWPMGGVWLCMHVWEHYAFGGDLNFLREAYPALRGACAFVLDFLVETADGRLTTSPSTSPEHKFVTPDGGRRSLSVGSTCDLSLIRDLLTNTIEATKALEIDADFAARLRQTLDRLATPRMLPDGRVAEWGHDFPEEDTHHRHVSQLLGVHPGREWAKNPAMLAAARNSLEVRGNASTGWSLAWKINLWARLGDGAQALDCIDMLLTPVAPSDTWRGGVYQNLFDAHPPFQIDGNFGFTSGVCEMLLQSHAGEIHLLPALPAAWPDGAVRGLRARGGVTVNLVWRGGRLIRAELVSSRSQHVSVRVGSDVRGIELVAGVVSTIADAVD